MKARPNPLLINTASGSDPGLVRQSNEDTVLDYTRPAGLGVPMGLLIVADGMGGHQAGDVASRLAVETVYQELRPYLEHSDADDTQPGIRLDAVQDRLNGRLTFYQERVRAAVSTANLAIHEYASSHPVEAGNLGTTVALVFIRGDRAIVANVGDSRVYLLRQQVLQQLTRDHSLVGHLIRNGQIEPQDVFDHPHRSIITRALGFNPDVQIDITTQQLEAGDRLLVCSDGLWEMIRDEGEIARELQQASSPQAAVTHLIEAANRYGGADNIGVVVAEMTTIPED